MTALNLGFYLYLQAIFFYFFSILYIRHKDHDRLLLGCYYQLFIAGIWLRKGAALAKSRRLWLAIY